MSKISVEYTCCGGQEYWFLNDNGDLEMTHAEIGTTCTGESLADVERLLHGISRVDLEAVDSTIFWASWLFRWEETVDGGDWKLVEGETETAYRLSYEVEAIPTIRDALTKIECYREQGRWVAIEDSGPYTREAYGDTLVEAVRVLSSRILDGAA